MKYLALLLTTMLFFSCLKIKPGRNLNPDLKKYFDYQSGSYWVFWDSLASYEDSVAGTLYGDRPLNGTSDETAGAGSMEEFYYNGVPIGFYWDIYLDSVSHVTFSIGNGINTMKYPLTAHWPIDTGKLNFATSVHGSYRVTTLLPTHAIGNITYNNVYRFLYFYNTNSQADTIYMNADSGFLAVLLNNKYFHKRLILRHANIVR